MRIIKNLQIRLHQLVPEPQCRILANDYDQIDWYDVRPLPLAEEVEAIDPTPYLPATVEAAKQAAIIDNFPSWVQIETVINNITDLAGAKAFLLKLARVVYWLARNSND